MHGQQKVDIDRALKLRAQGLSNAIIAKRLNVTTGAIHLVFRKHDTGCGAPQDGTPRRRAPCWT